jgi:hypothetical protein
MRFLMLFVLCSVPTFIFPSMIGRPLMRYEEEFKDVQLKDVMVGKDRNCHRESATRRTTTVGVRVPCSRRDAAELPAADLRPPVRFRQAARGIYSASSPPCLTQRKTFCPLCLSACVGW